MTEDAAVPTLVLIAGAAVLAPLLAEWSRRIVPVPEVVIESSSASSSAPMSSGSPTRTPS